MYYNCMNFKFEISKIKISLFYLLTLYFVNNNFHIFVFKIYFIMKIDLKIENAKKMESIFSVYTLLETTNCDGRRVK